MLMRKLGHIPEYLLLGVSSVIALSRWWKAGILCVSVSFVDQIVKGILPGRKFDFVEMRFDFLGYAVGIAIITLILRTRKHKRSENI